MVTDKQLHSNTLLKVISNSEFFTLWFIYSFVFFYFTLAVDNSTVGVPDLEVSARCLDIPRDGAEHADISTSVSCSDLAQQMYYKD